MRHSDPSQLDTSSAERDALISMSRTARLPEMTEKEFITQGYLATVIDSMQSVPSLRRGAS
jgi:hypothetical protein